jgi:hypothetical protein
VDEMHQKKRTARRDRTALKKREASAISTC